VSAPFDDYEAALEWLVGHYNLERQLGRPDVAVPTLDRMTALMGILGDPQASVPTVHLTGTNGKGSTSRIIVDVMAALGLAAGSYRSPHITRVNDRIAVANEPLDDLDFTTALAEIATVESLVEAMVGQRPNYFEVLSAAAFNWFAATGVDVNVIEVGLGGRWDATNVIDAEVAVITNIDADHLEIIGPTLADVAREKAGIIGPDSHVICGETDPALVDVIRRETCREIWLAGADFGVVQDRLAVGGRVVELFTPYGRHEEVFLPAHGAHQARNLAVAVAAVEAFFGRPLDGDVLAAGLERLSLPARFEIVGRQPLVIVDGAHNPAGARALADTLFVDFVPAAVDEQRCVLVVGCSGPHDPLGFLEAIDVDRFDLVVATGAAWPRSLPAADIEVAAQGLGAVVEVAGTVAEAVDAGIRFAGEAGTVVVTGSLYVASEARVHLQQ